MAGFTQTAVTVSATTSTSVASAAPRRSYLAIQNIGSNDAYLGFDGSATTTGWLLAAGGGGMVWEGNVVCPATVHAYSTAGTTLIVLEA